MVTWELCLFGTGGMLSFLISGIVTLVYGVTEDETSLIVVGAIFLLWFLLVMLFTCIIGAWSLLATPSGSDSVQSTEVTDLRKKQPKEEEEEKEEE